MENPSKVNEKQKITLATERALSEWRAAECLLEYAEDPELVECAIYSIEATRRKYLFLLRLARELEA